MPSSKQWRQARQRSAGHRLLHGERGHRALGREIPRRRGVRFLDAPVSGGIEGAKNGTLAIMCGGEPAAYEARETDPRRDGQDRRTFRPGRRGPGDQGHEPDHVRGHHSRLRRGHGLRRRSRAAARAGRIDTRRRRRLELVFRASRAEHGAWQLSGRISHQAACQGSRHLPRHGGAFRRVAAGGRFNVGRIRGVDRAGISATKTSRPRIASSRRCSRRRRATHEPPATNPASQGEEPRQLYLPDFCSAPRCSAVVIICELTALVLSLARNRRSSGFWPDLGRTSMFLLWIGLFGASFCVCCAAI